MPYAMIIPPGLSVSVPDAPWPFQYPYAMTFEMWLKPNGGNGMILDSPSNGGDQHHHHQPRRIDHGRTRRSGFVEPPGPTYLFDGNTGTTSPWRRMAATSAGLPERHFDT